MTYQFDIEHAEKYGVDEAIMLSNLIFWIRKNVACERNYNDGRTWTYNSASSFALLFPFWTEKQVRRVLASLVDQGVIITGNYNKSKMDRTRWFAMFDNGLLHLPIQEAPATETVTPIPDSKPDNKQQIKILPADAVRIANLIIDHVRAMSPKHKNVTSKLDSTLLLWAGSIEKSHRIDGRSYAEIERVFKLAVADSFWCKNILSGSKLREKHDDLLIKLGGGGSDGGARSATDPLKGYSL